MKIQPFKNPGPHGVTHVDNILVDSVMSVIKASSWVVLSIIMRQTTGWPRESDLITFQQIKSIAKNIKSDVTIRSALKELEEQGLIFVQSTRGKASFYCLNRNTKDYLKGSINEIKNGGKLPHNYQINEILTAGTICPVCSNPRVMGNGYKHAKCNNILSRDKYGIFKQADYKCLHCGETDTTKLTIDHIIPKIHGGSNQPDNLQSLCRSCNSRKGAKYDGN